MHGTRKDLADDQDEDAERPGMLTNHHLGPLKKVIDRATRKNCWYNPWKLGCCGGVLSIISSRRSSRLAEKPNGLNLSISLLKPMPSDRIYLRFFAGAGRGDTSSKQPQLFTVTLCYNCHLPSGRFNSIPIDKTKRCKVIVFRKGRMLKAGDSEAVAVFVLLIVMRRG